MKRNPFDEIGKDKEPLEYDEVTESALRCQEQGCGEIVTTGRYLIKEKILTWKCSDGHISKIEGIHL